MSWDTKLYLRHLNTRRFGREIEFFEEVDSTNRWLLQHYERFSTSGGVVIAEHQTAGRGRHDRRWFDVVGKSLLFSILLKHSATEPGVRLLSLLPAVALGEFLRETSPEDAKIEVKWPNDVLINGKKAAGVLGQSSGGGTAVVALGVGVNVSGSPDEFPPELTSKASSIEHETRVAHAHEMLLAEIMNRFEPLHDAVLEGDSLSVRRRWLALGPREGTKIVRNDLEGQLEGYFEGLGENGELLLRNQNGEIQTLVSGDIEYQ